MIDSILVTGGAGFIGGTFVRQLLHTGWQGRLVNLDLLTYAGNLESLADVEGLPNYTFVRGDIGDRAVVQELLREYACGAIINFAAESHVDRSISDPSAFLKTNVMGTFHLLDVALEYWKTLPEQRQQEFRFLHVSTDEVYGSLGPTGEFVESTPYAPNSPYSASKASSDHFVRAYHHTYGLPTLLTNCSNNYGPYQFPEKLIPLMTLNALEGKPLPVYGKGENVRDWLHVEDHCQALRLVLESGRPGEVYNIGGDCQQTNLQVVETICDTVDDLAGPLARGTRRDLITYVQDRPGHDLRYAVDCTKIKRALGWKAHFNFSTGIRQTVEWYLDHSQWVQGVTSGSYQRERLGLRGFDGEESAAADDAPANQQAMDVACAMPGVVFRDLTTFADARGWLIELYREDEVPAAHHPVMAYISETNPGMARGPHEHVDQADYFAFFGPGDFLLYLWDGRDDSPTKGQHARVLVGESNPQAVIVPAGVVHAYKNTSSTSGIVFNAPNRLYAGAGRSEPVDEIRHEDKPDSPFHLT